MKGTAFLVLCACVAATAQAAGSGSAAVEGGRLTRRGAAPWAGDALNAPQRRATTERDGAEASQGSTKRRKKRGTKCAKRGNAASSTSSAAAAANSATLNVKASPYFNLALSSSGPSFFDNWDFFTSPDPTHGSVNFLSATSAWNSNLISVSTTGGPAMMKVDSTSNLAQGANRNSIRITSKQSFGIGSLIILDANKIPYGPGVWPAFWSVGANWPSNGEIDIVEQVDNSNSNQYTLHTATGCTLSASTPPTGKLLTSNCDANVNYNAGCAYMDSSSVSFGPGFEKNGGGVFATHWDAGGISIYFFPRGSVPSDIAAGQPQFVDWGNPAARWDASTCDMNQFFGNQTLVFDTTLCGDWAGATYSQSGLPGTCASAVMNPSNFVNAVWEVNYVKVYTPK